MRIFLAYLLLLVFSALTVAGSCCLVVCPQMAVTYAVLKETGRPQTNYIPLTLIIAAVLFAFAYGGFYLLVKYQVNIKLARKIGFRKIVTLGFVLQLVMGLLFCIALLGGLQGSSGANIIIILVLCLPIVVRKLIQLNARDRSYDHFLEESTRD